MASPKGVAIQLGRTYEDSCDLYFGANYRYGTLYIGATSNLLKGAYEHREGINPHWNDLFVQLS